MDYATLKMKVRDLLINGQQEEALLKLYAYTKERHEDLADEVIYLLSNYRSNKERYEIKMTINKAEYDLAMARNMHALQQMMEKLEDPSGRTGKVVDEPKAGRRTVDRQSWMWPLLSLALLALISVTVAWQQSWGPFGSSKEPSEQTLRPSVESTLPGRWLARVNKTGYTIEQGTKTYFEDAEANWYIHIRADHTASMRGTKDTGSVARYRWFYNDQQQKLTMIDEENVAFEVNVKEALPQRQLWVTEQRQGNKVQRWEWRLRKKD